MDGKPKLQTMAEIEKELGNNLTLYGHSVTRGGNRVTITPSPSPLVWAPTLGENAELASFSANTLGQFLKSYEDTTGAAPRCKGLHRPVFEVRPAAPSLPAGAAVGAGSSNQYVLQPGGANRNPVWLFTTTKITLPAGSYICLG